MEITQPCVEQAVLEADLRKFHCDYFQLAEYVQIKHKETRHAFAIPADGNNTAFVWSKLFGKQTKGSFTVTTFDKKTDSHDHIVFSCREQAKAKLSFYNQFMHQKILQDFELSDSERKDRQETLLLLFEDSCKNILCASVPEDTKKVIRTLPEFPT